MVHGPRAVPYVDLLEVILAGGSLPDRGVKGKILQASVYNLGGSPDTQAVSFLPGPLLVQNQLQQFHLTLKALFSNFQSLKRLHHSPATSTCGQALSAGDLRALLNTMDIKVSLLTATHPTRPQFFRLLTLDHRQRSYSLTTLHFVTQAPFFFICVTSDRQRVISQISSPCSIC